MHSYYSSIALGLLLSLFAGCSASTTATTNSNAGASMAPARTAKVKPYPLDICIVTETGLHSMGSPITKVYNGQEIKFCCRPCIGKYEKNPERYNALL